MQHNSLAYNYFFMLMELLCLISSVVSFRCGSSSSDGTKQMPDFVVLNNSVLSKIRVDFALILKEGSVVE